MAKEKAIRELNRIAAEESRQIIHIPRFTSVEEAKKWMKERGQKEAK